MPHMPLLRPIARCSIFPRTRRASAPPASPPERLGAGEEQSGGVSSCEKGHGTVGDGGPTRKCVESETDRLASAPTRKQPSRNRPTPKRLTRNRLTRQRLTRNRLTRQRLTRKRLIRKRTTRHRLTRKRLTRKLLTRKRFDSAKVGEGNRRRPRLRLQYPPRFAFIAPLPFPPPFARPSHLILDGLERLLLLLPQRFPPTPSPSTHATQAAAVLLGAPPPLACFHIQYARSLPPARPRHPPNPRPACSGCPEPGLETASVGSGGSGGRRRGRGRKTAEAGGQDGEEGGEVAAERGRGKTGSAWTRGPRRAWRARESKRERERERERGREREGGREGERERERERRGRRGPATARSWPWRGSGSPALSPRRRHYGPGPPAPAAPPRPQRARALGRGPAVDTRTLAWLTRGRTAPAAARAMGRACWRDGDLGELELFRLHFLGHPVVDLPPPAQPPHPFFAPFLPSPPSPTLPTITYILSHPVHLPRPCVTRYHILATADPSYRTTP